MHSEGHIGLGLLLYAPIAFVLTLSDMMSVMAYGMVCATFFSYAPDFDLWLPYVAHRGATHTFLGGVVAGLGSAVIALLLAVQGALSVPPSLLNLLGVAGFAFGIAFLGVVSHLVGDVLTPMGIRPFRPWSARSYSLELVYASDEEANERLSYLGAVSLTLAIVAGVMARDGGFTGLF